MLTAQGHLRITVVLTRSTFIITASNMSSYLDCLSPGCVLVGAQWAKSPQTGPLSTSTVVYSNLEPPMMIQQPTTAGAKALATKPNSSATGVVPLTKQSSPGFLVHLTLAELCLPSFWAFLELPGQPRRQPETHTQRRNGQLICLDKKAAMHRCYSQIVST